MSNQAAMPILQKDLNNYIQQTNDVLKIASYAPRNEAKKYGESSTIIDTRESIGKSGMANTFELSKKILNIGNQLNPGMIIFDEACPKILLSIQKGLQIGEYIASKYEFGTKLSQLKSDKDNLSQTDASVLASKETTQAAIAGFCSAKYVLYELCQFEVENVEAVTMESLDIPDIDISNKDIAIRSLLYYYFEALTNSSEIKNKYDLLKFTILYYEKYIEGIVERSKGLEYLEGFTNYTFSLADSEFSITGFDSSMHNLLSAKISRLDWKEIVGNNRQKRMLMQQAQFLCSYNFNVNKNPVMGVIKDMSNIAMGDGFPGTGKTMCARAMGTQVMDICNLREVPFNLLEFPKTLMSKWVGGTSKATLSWFNKLKFTNAITYAYIDDAEGMLKDRGSSDQNNGSADVVQMFLTETEGASSVYTGRWMIHLLTNYPDLIDRAVMSRIKNRESIPGAQTRNDFIDQFHQWRKGVDLDLGDFDDISDTPSTEYVYGTDQEMSFDKAITSADQFKPQREEVKLALERADKLYGRQTEMFFAQLCKEFQRIDPTFTSREVRNVQVSADNRKMNFFYPEEYLKDPSTFLNLEDYDQQVYMLKGLVRDNLGDQKMSNILLVELLYAADNFFRINSNKIDREAKKFAENRRISEVGLKMYQDMYGSIDI